jgi:SOS-response transcriptional repressor LexA
MNKTKLKEKEPQSTEFDKTQKLIKTFAENFNVALDINNYPGLHFGRQVEVHKNFNISSSAARKWVMAGCLPDIHNLIEIADKLNVSLDFLFGRAPRLSTEPMVSIPIGTPQVSQGQWLEPFSAIKMEATWIESGMRMKHDNLFLMTVSGDNMSPTLADGDIVFVDASPIKNIRDLEENGIFLIMAHGRPQIRRIVFNFDETITLNSDNKQHPSVQLPINAFSVDAKDDSATLKIIGRIPWAIHRVARHSMSQFVPQRHSSAPISKPK